LLTVHASSLQQENGPVEQCAQGVQLNAEGKHDEAIPLLEAGYNNRELAHFPNQDDLGMCVAALGVAYSQTGKTKESLPILFHALELFRNNNNPVLEGGVLFALGLAYKDLGQYTNAIEHFQNLLKLENANSYIENLVLNNITLAYFLQGNYPRALEYAELSLTLSQETGSRYTEGIALNNIGEIYIVYGEYAKGLEYFQQSLVIRRKIGDLLGEGFTLNNIGAAYQIRGQHLEALKYYQEALVLRQDVGDLVDKGITLASIGGVYRTEQQYALAMEYYLQALKIMQDEENLPGQSAVLRDVGIVYSLQGDFSAALEYSQQALEIQHKLGNHLEKSLILSNIGVFYNIQGKYSEALVYLEQALESNQFFEDNYLKGTILENIGDIYRKQGQYQIALDYYKKAVEDFEIMRSKSGNDLARISFTNEHSNLYDKSVELNYQQKKLDESFSFTERGRARTFLDAMNIGYVEFDDSAYFNLFAQEQNARIIRQSLQESLSIAKSQNSSDEKLIIDLENQLEKAEQDYQTILDAIGERDDQLSQLLSGNNTVIDAQQTQALLDSDTTLVSFWVLNDQTLAFILTQDSFDVIALPVEKAYLNKQIEFFRLFANIDVQHPDSAMVLYNLLIEPLLPYLNTSNLVIVPHGELHYLPFAALTDGSEYLIEKYTLSYLPSVSAWPYIKENAEHAGGAGAPFVLGNPISDLRPLPYAENEVQAIASMLGVAPILGKDATESLLYQQAKNTSILHLAAHGNYNSNNPLHSTLFLSADEQEDGNLEVHEIYGLDLSQSTLVVLSACESQIGELSSGDELVGMTRAFFFAGAPSVMASLWNVDDQATQLIMEKFYAYWGEGMSQAEALQKAQIEMKEKYPNPYYWAAFVLSGEGGDLDIKITPEKLPTTEPLPESEKPNTPLCGGSVALIGIVFSIATRRSWNRQNYKSSSNV